MVKDFPGTFGDFLVMKRKERDMTIKDITKLLKISGAYYSFIETGSRKAPDREIQDRIADILELTQEERLILYDLVGKTRGTVAADLSEYINSNPYIRAALRRARDLKVSQEKWLKFAFETEH
jgi:transcriptional regulator with XRE-family HTH domain